MGSRIPGVSMTTAPRSVSLFVTCIVDMLYPEIGESVVAILERLGVEVRFPADQTCCGQPAFNSGHWDEARDIAGRNIEVLRDVEGAELAELPGAEECCGFGGLFSVKLPHISEAMLQRKVNQIESTG